MQDVAREAGVGLGTVSRVLNHSPNVDPRTAASVISVASRLGYALPARNRSNSSRARRNGNAKSFPMGCDVMLAVMGLGGLDWILHHAPVYAGVLHGVEAAITEGGGRMVVRQTPGWVEFDKAIHSDAPAGVVVIGSEPGSATERTVAKVPTVWTMGNPLSFHGDHVQPDHFRIGLLAADHCLRRGRRHCAAIGTGIGSPGALVYYRNDSFQWRLQQAGVKPLMLQHRNLVRRRDNEHAVEGVILDKLLAELLAQPVLPMALFLESDILAPAVQQRLIARGVRPGEDIEIITCNNEWPYLAALDPKPTIIDIQPHIIGRRTIEQLRWRTEHPGAPACRIMIEPVLLTNDSNAATPSS